MATSVTELDYHQVRKSQVRKSQVRNMDALGMGGAFLETPTTSPELSELMIEGLKRTLVWGRRPRSMQSNETAEAIVITDVTGRITMANGAALNIFYPTRAELLEKTCNDLLVEGQECPHTALLRDHSVIERQVFSRGGNFLLEVHANRLEDTEGRLSGFAHVMRDVTSERALEHHLIEAGRMSLAGLMASAVAHEVATPLSIIANTAEMLLMTSKRDAKEAAELNKIVTQARRIAEMTRRMSDFVHQRPAQFASVDIAELARETLGLLEFELIKARINFSTDCAPGTPAVWGDRAQLQQVLLNLITNAIQAMKRNGSLHIRIAESNANGHKRSVLIAVEDTGPGIPRHALTKMFDFYFTTKIAEGGTGLGLAISKRIIEGHGGTLRAENRAEISAENRIENMDGGGARLLIRLPAAGVSKAIPSASDDRPLRARHAAQGT